LGKLFFNGDEAIMSNIQMLIDGFMTPWLSNGELAYQI